MERPFDLELDASNVYEDRFIVLGLRIDRYRVPGAIIRSQMADEEQKLLTRSGKNRLSRNERLELRDKIVLRLRKKLAPSTRCLDVVWNLDAGLVLFFGHSRRVLADFAALFEKTFGLALVEDSPHAASERAALPAKMLRRLEQIEPLRLSSAKQPASEPEQPAEAASNSTPDQEDEPEETDELLQRIETTRFLGAEFLLWLWLRGEFVTQGISLKDGSAFHVWLDRQLTLESALDRNERVTIRGAAPADGNEAREAVRARKFPVKARIVMQGEQRDFTCGLDALRFAIASATVPQVLSSDSEEAFLERMRLAEELFGVLDGLYAAFLIDRLDDVWKTAWEPAIFAWLDGETVPAHLLQKLQPKTVARTSKKQRA
jgi:hypothetical protein